MLARLAHLVSRHRRPVIAVWIVLTLFGAFAASQVSKRWYQSFSIPGKSAYEANQRTLKTFGTGVRPPNVVVFHTSGDVTKSVAIKRCDAARRRDDAGRTNELVLLHRQPDVRLGRPAHDLRGGLPARDREVQHHERRRAHAGRRRNRAPRRHDRGSDGPRPARGSKHARKQRRPGRACRGADRRARRARDPPVCVRHAAGGADAARGRDGVDPEYVHAGLDPDLHHQRLDHRPVPDRAGRAGRGDRLRTADDLPLPRRAARRRRGRARAGGDDDACRPLRDRLRVDGGRRSALPDRDPAAVHPLDGHRRDADPARVGDHSDHVAAGAAGNASARGSTACG